MNKISVSVAILVAVAVQFLYFLMWASFYAGRHFVLRN